jgi:hypothetical protein
VVFWAHFVRSTVKNRALRVFRHVNKKIYAAHGFYAWRDRSAPPLARIFVKPGAPCRQDTNNTLNVSRALLAALFCLSFCLPLQPNPHNPRHFEQFVKNRHFLAIFSPQIKAYRLVTPYI